MEENGTISYFLSSQFLSSQFPYNQNIANALQGIEQNKHENRREQRRVSKKQKAKGKENITSYVYFT